MARKVKNLLKMLGDQNHHLQCIQAIKKCIILPCGDEQDYIWIKGQSLDYYIHEFSIRVLLAISSIRLLNIELDL